MEAFAVFMGWSLLIAIATCTGIFVIAGTYIGIKAMYNEFLKGQIEFNTLHRANQQIHVLEATNRSLEAMLKKKG